MARRPNYGFEKRQKELDRQKRKDAKAERKQAKSDERARGTDEVASGEATEGGGADAVSPGDRDYRHCPES
jgi:hypothetical protein